MYKLPMILRGLLLGFIILPVASLQAKDWYLSPDGSATVSASCWEVETPCKNIHTVVNSALFEVGDKILLQTGTYDLNASAGTWGGPLNKAFEIYGGYNADYTDRVVDARKTI